MHILKKLLTRLWVARLETKLDDLEARFVDLEAEMFRRRIGR